MPTCRWLLWLRNVRSRSHACNSMNSTHTRAHTHTHTHILRPPQVCITYEPPVVLAAASSSPDALGNLGFKGDLEVEVKNSQRCEPAPAELLVQAAALRCGASDSAP